MKPLYLLLAGLLSVTARAQTIRYVTVGGTNPNPASATTWATSTNNLQAAINASASGDQVWVATGIYRPTSGNNRSVSFALKNGVAVYGGFVGTETSLTQRPASIPTVGQPASTLSGDIGISGNNADNSYHVIRNTIDLALSNSAVLNGFIIRGGNATDDVTTYGSGGGMLNEYGNPTVVNCLFWQNSADVGGGLCNVFSDLVITNCQFLENTAATAGGGVYNGFDPRSTPGNTRQSTVRLANCSFLNNSALAGGGLATATDGFGGFLITRATNCLFRNNTASDRTIGEVTNEGRGAAVYMSTTIPLTLNQTFLTNCTFVGNTLVTSSTIVQGRAIDADILSNGIGTLYLTNSIVFGNGSPALLVDGSNATMVATNNLFQDGLPPTANATNRVLTSSPFVTTTDLQPGSCSPAINAGDVANYQTYSESVATTDLAGNPRLRDGADLDIGAYQYTGPPTVRLLTTPAAGTALCGGSNLSLPISASGVAPMAYQWFKDGTAMVGQIFNTLTLINVSTASIGGYRLRVTDGCNNRVRTPTFGLRVDSQGQRLYVRANATGANTGLSWADATPDLQVALGGACSQPTEIWVATGTYKPTQVTTNRLSSFALRNNLALYGGFAGTETLLSQRPAINATRPASSTLSGEINNDGSPTGNSQHVVTAPPASNATALLDGFVVTGGNANGAGNEANGGGLFINTGSPSVGNCWFQSNVAVGFGGGVYGEDISGGAINARFTNCVFRANQAAYGGGFSTFSRNNNNASPTLINCLFQSNLVTTRGGAIAALAGASTNTIRLVNCSLLSNAAFVGGSSFYARTSVATGPVPAGQVVFSSANSVVYDDGTDILNSEVFNAAGAGNASITASNSLFKVLTNVTGSTNLAVSANPFVSVTDARLALNSPALSFGNVAAYTATAGPATDLYGNPRFRGGLLDAGAYQNPFPTRLYVRAGASGANTGLTWADAFDDLQAALTYFPTTNLSEIWVATGTFRPTFSTTPDSRTASFGLLPGVALYGGFAGSETTLSQRPPISLGVAGGMTLSGEIGDTTTTADNSYHVVRAAPGLSSSARLDGFTIRGGRANGGGSDNNGAGLLAQSSTPTVANCLFVNNVAAGNGGGASYATGSSAGLFNTSFMNNTATVGGGLHGGTVGLTVTNCSFLSNGASSGGAVASVDFANTQLVNCVLWDNGGAASLLRQNNGQLSARYCLVEPSVTGFTGSTGNGTTTLSPFASVATTRLRLGSPAIDSADPATTTATVGSTDLARLPRFVGTLDRGATEFQNELVSVAAGNWNVPTTWNANRVPLIGDRVRLAHAVTLPASYNAFVGTLFYSLTGTLRYGGSGAGLRVVP